MSKFTKKCMICPAGHTFLCKFWHFQMAVSSFLLGLFIPNLRFLWIFVCSFRLCESIVANPIIYRLVPSVSRYEIRQCQRNISRHCWAQHFARVWPPCCDLLQHVGCCWFKFENAQIWVNRATQHVAAGWPNARDMLRQQCCDMLRWHIAIVWPGP